MAVLSLFKIIIYSIYEKVREECLVLCNKKQKSMLYVFIYVTEYHVIKHVALGYNNKLSIEKEYKINFFLQKWFKKFWEMLEFLTILLGYNYIVNGIWHLKRWQLL